MASQEDVTQMASLMQALTQPDTNTIRQAEVALKPILKDARSIPALLEVLKGRGVQPNAVRHVSAIILRKRIGGHYSKFQETERTNFRAQVLTILANEPERAVRGGVVGVAATICKIEQGTGWNELWQFVAAAASDPHPDARELAFWLLQEMTDIIGTHLKSQFEHLAKTLFSKALEDSEVRVQRSSVKALGQLLSFLANEPEVEIFCQLLPSVLNVAAAAAGQDPSAANASQYDEDTVSTVLDVLYDLAFSPSPAVTSQLGDMVKFALLCMANKEMEMGVRDSAALVIATLAEAKPKSFGKDEAMLNSVLDTIFALIEHSPESAAGALLQSNPAWKEDMNPNDGDFDEDDSPTETSMAQGTLDMLACEVPKKYLFQPAMSRCVARISSSNANQRKAGIACLGVIAEGCSEPLREHLSDVMPHVFSAAGDADSQVRECCCFALGQISEHCQPEILGFSSQILPIVFALLDDTTVSVQATSCYVLEMFCERLEPDAVRPLLDPLVRKLAAMLEATTKRSVQEMAVAALAATAVAAEEEFTPYVGGVAALMTKLMALQEERLYTLRGRALECMGHMAIAVGKQTFRPYFTGTMQCACDGLATESTDLHEFAYAVFANLSKVMGTEFAPVLPDLIPHLVKVIDADEGTMEKAEEEEKNGDFANLDDSDNEDNEDGYVLHVRTALLEAKKGAITAIGEMAAHTGSAFVPHLEDVMEVLHNAGTNHWHPIIKCEVAEALPSMVVPSVAAYHNGEIAWEKGDVSGANPMSQHTAAITSAVLNELLGLMKEDDKETVGKACEGIQSVIELVGPHALVPVSSECLKSTHELLTKKAPCQRSDEAFESLADEEEDDDDHDAFMTSVCDLLGSFARVMGSHFKQYLKEFLPVICDYCKSSRPPSDRSMAMGCLGELAQELEGAISEHWTSVFLPAILAGLGDPDDNVKRNAAFCTGVCCEALGQDITGEYPRILAALSPLFAITSTQESSLAAVDNAAAAVSRMIMACPTHVPLNQVLTPVLKALPLKTDLTENETVYTCLLGLIQMNNSDLLANKEEVKRILVEATSESSKVAEEIQEKLKVAAQSLNWG